MIKSHSASLGTVSTEMHLTASFVLKIASVDVTNSGGEIEVRRQLWHTKWHTHGVDGVIIPGIAAEAVEGSQDA